MAKAVICSGGGGGSGSDDCTALRSYVVEGYTAITQDSDDEPAEGTMVDRGTYDVEDVANNSSRNCINVYLETGAYRIKTPSHQNRHPVWVPYNILSNAIGLTPSKLWPGNTVAGVTSNKETMAGQTITPKSTQQTVQCNGKAMTGNIIVAGDSDLVASNIKLGANIFGVAGSANGFVCPDGYIYYRGDNPYNFALTGAFGVNNVYGALFNEPGGAYFRPTNGLNIRMWISGSQVNLTGVSTIRLQLRLIDGNSAEAFNVQLYYGSNKNTTQEGIVKVNTTMKWSEFNVDIDVSSISGNKYLGFYFGDLSETNVFSVHGVQLL